jgi:hypothetical protein
MKKLLLLCCLSLFAFASNAQLIYTQVGDTATYLNQPNDAIYKFAYFKFYNPTNAPITITWTRTNFEYPTGWDSPGMCDDNTCYSDFSSSKTYIVQPGDTASLHSQIRRTANGVKGCAYAIATLSEPGKGLKTITFIHTSETNTVNSFCSPLATKDFDITKSVDVYPNPTSNFINVKINNSLIQNVTVTNIIGKKLSRYTFDINKSNIFRIEMDQLPNGIYMLQFADKNGNNLGVKKLTKN